jgi:hypothetical protein
MAPREGRIKVTVSSDGKGLGLAGGHGPAGNERTVGLSSVDVAAVVNVYYAHDGGVG